MRFYEGGFINERRITYGNWNARTRPLFKLIELYKLIQKVVHPTSEWTTFSFRQETEMELGVWPDFTLHGKLAEYV